MGNNLFNFSKSKNLFIVFFIGAIFIGVSVYIFFSFIQDDRYFSKAKIGFNTSISIKTVYGDYNNSNVDVEAFKSMLVDKDIFEKTGDSLKIEKKDFPIEKMLSWHKSSSQGKGDLYELKARSNDKNISNILSTLIHFYEAKIERILKVKIANHFLQHHENQLPKLISKKEHLDDIIDYYKQELKDIDSAPNTLNIKKGQLTFYDPRYSFLVEGIEKAKAEREGLNYEIKNSEKTLREINDFGELKSLSTKGILLNILEVQETSELLPRKSKKYSILGFSITLILGFFALAFRKMTYVSND